MPVLASIQSGSFSSATTWGVIDNTSFLDSRAASTLLTTTNNLSSVAFAPGAITISGVAIQIQGRSTSPTGTITMRLWNNTAGSTVKDVTINISDLPSTFGATTDYIGWTYFKFDVNVTLLAGTQYTIRMFSSTANEVAVYRNATANNWSRALITTTTGAPANGDTIIVCGEHTAAGVGSTYNVTMDSTSNTNGYGPVYLGARSVFQYGTASSTNYKFRISTGIMLTGRGSTFRIGDVTNPIPATSTAEFEMTCASAGQFNIQSYGTITTYGATMTHRALLNADIAAGATTSTTVIATGWKNGDLIAMPSTTTTVTQFESVTLNADAVGTTLTHNAVTNAHGGSASLVIKADLANLTRNIRFFSTNTTNRGYLLFTTNSSTSIFYTSFINLGYSTSAGAISTSSAGSFNFQYNSVYQTVAANFVAFNTVATVSNNVFYNLGISGSGSFNVLGTFGDNNVFIGCNGFGSVSGSIGNNNVISSTSNHGFNGTINGSNNSIYSTAGFGWYNTSVLASTTVSNLKVWRCNNSPIFFSVHGTSRSFILTLDNLQMHGHTSTNISITSGRVFVTNSYFWGSTIGVGSTSQAGSTLTEQVVFQNCIFGRRPNGTLSAFSTACIATSMVGLYTFYNCQFSGTEASYATYVFTQMNPTNGYMSFNHNNVSGDHRQFQLRGLQSLDTTYSITGRSVRLTPQVTNGKTYSSTYRIAVRSGNTCRVSVQVRKSAAPDAVYNGAQPRLMLTINLLAGINTEVVCATASAASNGAWETLTYTSPPVTQDSVLEFYVDCDGTAGFINVDDFETTTYNDTRSGTFMTPAGSYIEAGWRKAGGSNTFIA